MSELREWKKVKRSGAFRRKIKKKFENIMISNKKISNNTPACSDSLAQKVMTDNSNNNDTMLEKESKDEKLSVEGPNFIGTSDSNNDLVRENRLVQLEPDNGSDLLMSDLNRNSQFSPHAYASLYVP